MKKLGLLTTFLALGLTAACSQKLPHGSGMSAEEINEVAPKAGAEAVEETEEEFGIGEARAVTITVDDKGYHPAEITAKPGEKLALAFTRTTTSRCAEKLVIPDAEVEKALPVGTKVRVVVTAPESGRLAFACGMGMMKGAVVVGE